MPSLALRTAWFMPRICVVILLAMARPAASSFAELMRLPVERRSIAVWSDASARRLLFCARSAAVFVLITVIERPSQLDADPVTTRDRPKAEPEISERG